MNPLTTGLESPPSGPNGVWRITDWCGRNRRKSLTVAGPLQSRWNESGIGSHRKASGGTEHEKAHSWKRCSRRAADLGVRHAYAPVFTWAGLYGGIHLGYVWNDPELVASADTRLVTTPVPTIPTGVLQGSAVSPPGSINDNSGHRFVGGGQVGYNSQFAPNWLLGLRRPQAHWYQCHR